MILNQNCVRDVLLFLENRDLGSVTRATTIAEHLPDYSRDDVIYTVKKLFEAKFIDGNESEGRHSAGSVKEITWNGHKFLDNIRSKEAWDIVTDKARTFGSVSIDILSNAAAQVGAALLSKALGL